MKACKRLAFLVILALLMLNAVALFAADSKIYKIGSNRVGSAWYVQATVIANVVSKAFPEIHIEADPIAGGIANLKLMSTYKMDTGFSMSNLNKWGYEGIPGTGFEKPLKNLRALIGGLDTQYDAIVVRKGCGITSIEGIPAAKPKIRVMTVPKGALGEVSTAHIFESCGFTYDDVKKWGGAVDHTDFEAIVTALKDGRGDLFSQPSAIGHPSLTELAVSGKVDFIGLGDKALKYLEKYGYVVRELPAGTYKGQDKPLKLPAQTSVITTNDQLPDEIAYKFVKALCENREELIKGHASFVDFIPEKSCLPENVGMPLHPGAEKYFKERGWL